MKYCAIGILRIDIYDNAYYSMSQVLIVFVLQKFEILKQSISFIQLAPGFFMKCRQSTIDNTLKRSIPLFGLQTHNRVIGEDPILALLCEIYNSQLRLISQTEIQSYYASTNEKMILTYSNRRPCSLDVGTSCTAQAIMTQNWNKSNPQLCISGYKQTRVMQELLTLQSI